MKRVESSGRRKLGKSLKYMLSGATLAVPFLDYPHSVRTEVPKQSNPQAT